MNDFINFSRKLVKLDEDAEDDLVNKLQIKRYKKGDFILNEGEICRFLYFIESGLVKLFFTTENKAFIMRFFPENSMFTLLDSYFTQTPANYKIVALEATTIILTSYDEMEQLCKKHHCIETLVRRLISLASINMMKRISEMLEEDASHRYHNFVKDNNAILQRINLGDLACYLGITQVSLSRIRGH